ncbi:MAG: hypothetical protein HYT82_01015 [Candidatus Harrisonbacteria bacterium]|nr:hypothetical protein [Candidatus Harrisonbacteria bacterium]
MKGDFTLAVLKLIQASAMTAVGVADVLTYYGRDAHYARLRGISTPLPRRSPILENVIAAREERRRVLKLISKLRSEGFIAQQDSGRALELTANGNKKVSALERQCEASNALRKITPSDTINIVAFDIPEEKGAHRDWIRAFLKRTGFTRLQKSFWIGKLALPEEFFDILHRRGIVSNVEVFAVTKKGTLRQLHQPKGH